MTKELKICSLYSGSAGNCIYVESPEARILIDAGKSAKTLSDTLLTIGSDIKTIDAIFITHEHVDHVSAVATLVKKHHIPVHAVAGCANAILEKCDCAQECIVPHDPKYSVKVKDMTVSSFLVSHDSACCVGYKVVTDGGDSFGLMTDTGIVTNSAAEALTGCRAAMIESNHDLDMLVNGSYPQDRKDRVGSRFGHICNDIAARFAVYLAEHGTENFILAHISPNNNTPELALSTTTRALEGKNCTVKVSSQEFSVFME